MPCPDCNPPPPSPGLKTTQPYTPVRYNENLYSGLFSLRDMGIIADSFQHENTGCFPHAPSSITSAKTSPFGHRPASSRAHVLHRSPFMIIDSISQLLVLLSSVRYTLTGCQLPVILTKEAMHQQTSRQPRAIRGQRKTIESLAESYPNTTRKGSYSATADTSKCIGAYMHERYHRMYGKHNLRAQRLTSRQRWISASNRTILQFRDTLQLRRSSKTKCRNTNTKTQVVSRVFKLQRLEGLILIFS